MVILWQGKIYNTRKKIISHSKQNRTTPMNKYFIKMKHLGTLKILKFSKLLEFFVMNPIQKSEAQRKIIRLVKIRHKMNKTIRCPI